MDKPPKIENSDAVIVGVLQPGNIAVPLSLQDLYVHILAHVERFALGTSLFITENSATATVTPCTFAFYLYALALTWISRHGNLAGTAKNSVSMNPEQYVVPLGFAKYLEHLAPYTEGQASIRTYAVLDALPTITQSQFGPSVQTFGIDVSALSLPDEIFYLMTTVTGSVGEYQMMSTAISLTLDSLWSVYADDISQAIASSGYSCVAFEQIKKTAPNASAYAVCVNDFTDVPTTPSDVNSQWACPFINFDAEEALLFRSFSSGSDIPFQPIRRRIVSPGPVQVYDNTYPNDRPNRFSMAHYFNAWIGSRQTAYRPGAILKSYVLCELPVKTLAFSYQRMSSRAIYQLAWIQLAQYFSVIQNTPSTQEISRLVFLFFQILLHMVTCRINEASPKHYLSGLGGTLVARVRNPQTAYVSATWLSIPLPPSFVRFIDGIGPALVDGIVLVPRFDLPTSDPATGAPYYADGASYYPYFGLGQTAGDVSIPTGFGSNGMTWTAFPDYQWAPNDVLLTAGVMTSAYYTNGLAHQRMLFINNQLGYYLNQYNALLTKFNQGETVAKALVHTHNGPCGSVALMLAKTTQQFGDRVVQNPPEGYDGAVTGTWQSVEAVVVGSLVNMSPSDLVEATMYAATIPTGDTDNGTAVWRTRLSGANSTTTTLRDFCRRTFTPGSAFADTLAIREASFQPAAKTIAGIDILPVDATEGCWVKGAIKAIGNTIYPSLRTAGGAGAGLLCATFSPVAKPLAGMVCKRGAEMAMDTLASFVGVEVEGHNPPKQKDFTNMRQTVKVNPAPRAIKVKPVKKKVVAKARLEKNKLKKKNGAGQRQPKH